MTLRSKLLLIAGGLGTAVGVRSLLRRRHRFGIRGKSVLVTGGSRGLGFVLARELCRQGARVAICARSSDELSAATEELRRRGGTAIGVVCDLTSGDEVDAMVQEVRATYGRIDAVINNAGIIQVGPLETMVIDDYERAMDIHFWAALRIIDKVLPEMRERGGGRIVNISSIGGRVSVPHMLPYTVSKYALTGFSRGLRAELAKEGILVTTVHPGLMRTGSPLNALFKGQHDREFSWFNVSASLPGLTMSATRAARRIVRALDHGEPEVVLTVIARIGLHMHDLAPNTTYRLLGTVNRMLPAPGGIETEQVPGYQSHSRVPSWLVALGERAAKRNNELIAGRSSER